MSKYQRTFWRVVQLLAWAAGMFVWGALIIKPALGLHLLWNVLIPVAPALLVVAPGIRWNVCPLGSMSLAPHHFGLSRRKRLSPVWRGRLYLGAFLLLMLVVPARKVVLDTNGPLLAAVLGVVGVLAIAMGFLFNQKSGWCSSLCPVYPVELMYGSRPLLSVPNAHCPSCSHCVEPCSESTAGLTPTTAVNTHLGRCAGAVLIGVFPGFVWGWYNVPTYNGWQDGAGELHVAYGIPYAAGALTLAVYLVASKMWPIREGVITCLFAAAAIITYYWFRLPPMFGIGAAESATIVDISARLPDWSATALRALMIAAFGWLMILRSGKARAWETRPRVAAG